MRDIRKAKVEYVTDAAQKSSTGTIADLSDPQELADVLDRERALINGHADLRFTGLITPPRHRSGRRATTIAGFAPRDRADTGSIGVPRIVICPSVFRIVSAQRPCQGRRVHVWDAFSYARQQSKRPSSCRKRAS